MPTQGYALLDSVSGMVPVTIGGTGASTAAVAATNLGLGTGNSPTFNSINLATGGLIDFGGGNLGLSHSANVLSLATATGTAELRFVEASPGANYVGFKAASTLAADVMWTLPTADGTNGQVLTTSGAGALSWSSAGASGWSDDGTVVRLTTATDNVAIGAAAAPAGFDAHRAYIVGAVGTIALIVKPVLGAANGTTVVQIQGPSETGSGSTALRAEVQNSSYLHWSMRAGGNSSSINAYRLFLLGMNGQNSSGSIQTCLDGDFTTGGNLGIGQNSSLRGRFKITGANLSGTTGDLGVIGQGAGLIGWLDHDSTGAQTGDTGGVLGYWQMHEVGIPGAVTTAYGVKGLIAYDTANTGASTIATAACFLAQSPTSTVAVGTGGTRTITTAAGLLVRNQGTVYNAGGFGTATITDAIGVDILAQSGATTNRAIRIGATGVNNAFVWGNSALQYANAAENIRFTDSTNARGIDFTLTAAGAQTIGTTAGALMFNAITGFTNAAITLGAAVTTFAITTSSVTLTGDVGANTIATITGATTSGQILIITFVDALVTITDDGTGAANSVNLSAAFTSTANDTLTLIYNGTSWREIARAVN